MGGSVRIGWVMDDPGYKGGAELEADLLAANAPGWAEIVPCPLTAVAYDVDAYVIHNCAAATDRLIGFLEGKRVVKRVHDLWRDGDAGLRAWLLKHADVVLLSSPLQHGALAWRIEAPIAYVPSAVDAPALRAAAGGANGRAGAMWLGRLYDGKGIGQAGEWARAAGVEIDVYGFGALEGAVKPPLRYCGQVAAAEVPALMAQYERFVFLPDAVEPYGRAAAEAWLAGCELIVNHNVGALWWIENEPEAVGDGAARFWREVGAALGVDESKPEGIDVYATHLPALRAVCNAIRPVRVLEFGGGLYSTPFLSTHAEQVVTVEADDGWRARLAARGWPNVDVRAAFEGELGGYDLIFIDDGQSADERANTIQRVTAAKPGAVTVIHDFEQRAYQQAASGFDHRVVFDGLTPHTGVLWNGKRPELEGLLT